MTPEDDRRAQAAAFLAAEMGGKLGEVTFPEGGEKARAMMVHLAAMTVFSAVTFRPGDTWQALLRDVQAELESKGPAAEARYTAEKN